VDIAIVSPSPIPYAVGGIEKLMLGMYTHLDELTDHRIELIKLPTDERGFWELIASYKAFYNLNLDHFDMVISCKYPAWMINHKNHVVYMAHHLRGLFDTYHFTGMPEVMKKTAYNFINEILDYTLKPENLKIDLNDFFAQLELLHEQKDKYPADLFIFPGPFIRSIVHFMDKWALDPSRISRYTAISQTVKARENYFPNKVDIEVIYPPTSLSNLKEGDFEYFLIVGRLDGAKRVSLVLEAMKHISNPNIKMLIAGSGPDEIKLKNMAYSDSRIKFIGYTNNEKLKNLYSNALGVIYIPYDEDYGLVTIEAMHCGKPVITCSDSGGTTEFVIHEKTGLVASNDSKDIAKQMEKLANNIDYAVELGSNARASVESINWNNCINALLNFKIKNKSSAVQSQPSTRKKLIVLSTYPVFPKKHGGQLRIFNLYKNLDHQFDITILSFNNDSLRYEKKRGNLTEITIPITNKHKEMEWVIEREVGIPITDVVMKQLSQYTPDFHKIANKLMEKTDIIVASHPFLYHLISKYVGDKLVIYDSHNVEYILKKSLFPNNKTSIKLLSDLFEQEKEACQTSDLILSCSEEDTNKIIELYDVPKQKIIHTPNGVDLDNNPFVAHQTRQKKKEELGLENENLIVFIGSWHKPNIEAVEEILKMAPLLPDCKFIIVGGQCLAFKGRTHSPNVVLAGIVEENMKELIYSVADIAINPMINGSGTNLKIAEYMACGVPVISTPIGARGYGFVEGTHLILSEINNFIQSITLLLENKKNQDILSRNGREFIAENFTWKNISNNLARILNVNY
jgi:glycosyltransferase involved in cell wall biosynthesis